jgi:Protein of unknown function (DUF5818)
MRKTVLTVATVVLLYAIAVGAAPLPRTPQVFASVSPEQSGQQSKRPQIRTFLGTITKAGNQFVFSDDVSKNSYQLDDQKTASKFDGEKVKVTGTLDATNNVIRVQSIEATA